ncbi:YgiT-type zinc finger protein [Candidatus Woesearchaeota archaeon]|nr:YgiT-type zinc finger protein [Candidatus Woesearchaeota archaeon]MBT6518890.1 YgiT-type zinc finger protein [Candidatus Woesearchaeota archaeon]MBT7368492.1 YgiT-type zinc finger protein [Candidatus Woesearchaeota archaeon]
MIKCYECGKGNLLKKQAEYRQYDILIGKFPAEVCSKCGEVFFSSESVDKIEEKLKKKNLWGLGSQTTIGTSGNSLDIKLGKKLVEFFDLQKGQRVIIEPKSSNRFEVEIVK